MGKCKISKHVIRVTYLSISDVEGLSQLGKVFIDVNGLQSPTISSQTFVKRNGVTLKDIMGEV